MVSVDCLAFTRLLNVPLLAAKYNTGEMVLFDTIEGCIKATTSSTVVDLVTSPDGRTLAGSDVNGTIELWDVETMRRLHRIKARGYGISALSFSYDSCRLLDIRGRGRQCRVWEPAALYRREIENGSGKSLTSFFERLDDEVKDLEDDVLVTAISCHESLDVFFVGKQDGAVLIYDLDTGQSFRRPHLFKHGNGITALGFDPDTSKLMSIDSAGRLMVHIIPCYEGVEWEAELIFEYRGDGVSLEQFICN